MDWSGAALVGVRLTLQPEDTVMAPGPPPSAVASVQSDANGKFKFDNLTAGRYRVLAEKSGYVSQAYGARSGSQSGGIILSIAEGLITPHLAMTMVPAPSIVGKILNEDRDPFPGVPVRLVQRQFFGGRWGFAEVAGAVSERPNGGYRIAGVTPGRYFLVALPPKRNESAPSKQPRSKDETYADTYYPGTLEPEQAAPVQLTPGTELSLNIQIAKGRLNRVVGKVAGNTRPQTIMLTPQGRYGPNLVSSASPAADGSFEFKGVANGLYTLIAGTLNLSVVTGWKNIEVRNVDIENIELETHDPFELSGRVLISSDDGHRDEGPPATSGLNLRVTLSPGEFRNAGKGAIVEANGSFSISGLLPKKYQVLVPQTPSGLYLSSVEMAGRDVLSNGLDLSAGMPADPLLVILKRSPGEVSGYVEDGDHKAMPGVPVTLVPDPARPQQTNLYRKANTDQNGRFFINNVPPGTYAAYAWTEIEPGAEFDLDYLRPHAARSAKVVLEQGSHQIIRLTVIDTDLTP